MSAVTNTISQPLTDDPLHEARRAAQEAQENAYKALVEALREEMQKLNESTSTNRRLLAELEGVDKQFKSEDMCHGNAIQKQYTRVCNIPTQLSRLQRLIGDLQAPPYRTTEMPEWGYFPIDHSRKGAKSLKTIEQEVRVATEKLRNHRHRMTKEGVETGGISSHSAAFSKENVEKNYQFS